MVLNGQELDFGVYETSRGASHAIVYGEEDWEYCSGLIDMEDDHWNSHSHNYTVNLMLYKAYLKGKQNGKL